jgi:hypothetical protein
MSGNPNEPARALMVSTTNLPMMMNVFHNEAFVFGSEFDFTDRAGKKEYISGEGDLITVRPGNHMWETNFVPDLTAIELKTWGDRGAGGTNIMGGWGKTYALSGAVISGIGPKRQFHFSVSQMWLV